MKRAMSVLAVVLWVSVAVALEDSPANREAQADRYLKATPPAEMFKDLADQMSRQMPPEQRKLFVDLMTRHLDIESVTKVMKASLVKHFTAEELSALADFYGSAVGKAAMKKMGVYMADVMPGIQVEMARAQQRAAQEAVPPQP